MREKVYAIMASDESDDLQHMKVVQVLSYAEGLTNAITAFNKHSKVFKYCRIVETIYG